MYVNYHTWIVYGFFVLKKPLFMYLNECHGSDVISHIVYAVHKWCCLDNGSWMNPTRKTSRQKAKLISVVRASQCSSFLIWSFVRIGHGSRRWGWKWQSVKGLFMKVWDKMVQRCNLVFSKESTLLRAFPYAKITFESMSFRTSKGGIWRTRGPRRDLTSMPARLGRPAPAAVSGESRNPGANRSTGNQRWTNGTTATDGPFVHLEM